MITELTEEQKKMIPVYVEKWAKVGLSTEPIKDYEETINLFYEKILNRKKPAKIILSRSPLQALEQVEKMGGKHRKNVVWETAKVIEQVEEQVRKQVTGQLCVHIRDQVNQIVESVRSQIGIRVWKQVREQRRGRVSNEWYIVFDFRDSFGNCAFFDYLNEVLDIQYPENWPIYRRAAELGLIYMLDNICIISDRPEQISIKNGVLHNETCMTIKYRDGWGIFILNGVRVTKEIVETPADKLDPEIILKETNVEVRREIVRKIGVERLEKKLKPRVLDKWGDYELCDYSEFFPEMRCRPVYLKMKNPSIGVWHYEGVNIDEMEAPTCQAALKWRLKGKDFKPIRIT